MDIGAAFKRGHHATLTVVCDAERALREIVDHLHAQGYRRPGFMSGASALSTALKRRQYFVEFWKEKGVEHVKALSAERYSAEAGRASIRDYMDNTTPTERIDVLMCENDILALGAMDELRGTDGLSVPNDIAIVGFDNYEFGGTAAFGLTTYEQPKDAMIDAIIDMVTGRKTCCPHFDLIPLETP